MFLKWYLVESIVRFNLKNDSDINSEEIVQIKHKFSWQGQNSVFNTGSRNNFSKSYLLSKELFMFTNLARFCKTVKD